MTKRVAVLVLLAVAGCAPSVKDEVFVKAQSLFDQQDYAQAEQAFLEYARQKPSSKWVGEAWLYVGRARLALKNYAGAREAFEQAAKLGRGQVVAKGRMGVEATDCLEVADAAYGLHDFPKAVGLYQKAFDKYRDTVDEAQMLYAIGLGTIRTADWTKGRETLRDLALRFPRARQAKEARRILEEEREDVFSVQVEAYTEKPLADKLQKELTAKGLGPVIVNMVIREGTTYHRVRVGKFKTWQEAWQFRDKVVQAGYANCMVVP